jgi:hypothetical protein
MRRTLVGNEVSRVELFIGPIYEFTNLCNLLKFGNLDKGPNNSSTFLVLRTQLHFPPSTPESSAQTSQRIMTTLCVNNYSNLHSTDAHLDECHSSQSKQTSRNTWWDRYFGPTWDKPISQTESGIGKVSCQNETAYICQHNTIFGQRYAGLCADCKLTAVCLQTVAPHAKLEKLLLGKQLTFRCRDCQLNASCQKPLNDRAVSYGKRTSLRGQINAALKAQRASEGIHTQTGLNDCITVSQVAWLLVQVCFRYLTGSQPQVFRCQNRLRGPT